MKIFKTSWISALMNIIGLGIAFAVFLILMSQVWWDYRYDRFKGGKDVYMVENLSSFDGNYSPMVTRPAVQKIKDCSPDIVAACDFFGRKGCNQSQRFGRQCKCRFGQSLSYRF